jgi:hypothetical protein
MDYIIEENTINFVNDLASDYEIDLNDITYEVIEACMKVHNTIGKGFLEVSGRFCNRKQSNS